MANTEAEIERLEEEIKKLEDEKKTAQLSAQSGEHIYSNVKIAMQHIDQAPPEIQRDLLRALIENITVYEDKIVMNMFIQVETLPDILQIPPKEKSPIPIKDQDKAFNSPTQSSVASAGSVSQRVP